MTRTLTAPTSEVTTPPATNAGSMLSRRVSTGRGLWVGVGVAMLLLILAMVAWKASDWAQMARAASDVKNFTVVPRNFTVVLEEKGELQAAHSTEVTCKVQGRSTIIKLIPEGTAVKKGDLLVELATDQIEENIRQEELREANAITAYETAKTELDIQRDKNGSDIRKAKLRIELTRLALDKYAKGDWTQKLKDAQIAIDQAKINLKRRGEDYAAAVKLFARDFITKTQYDEDEFNHQKAKWDLEKALKAKEVLETYTHVADLRQRESDLEEAKKESERVAKNADAQEMKKRRDLEGKKKELDLIQEQLAKLRAQREECRIFAPTNGFVVYYAAPGRHFMSSESQIREGATVHERQILMTLPDTSKMLVLVRIHEAKTDKLHLGQPVVIRIEGLPDRQFTGTVTKIAAIADTQNRWLNPDLKEYETEITLDPTDAILKPGVTAHAEILVENVEQQLAVPVQSIYASGQNRYVFSSQGNEVKPVKVKVGAIGAEWAQITDGLKEGDKVLLAFTDTHKRLVSSDLPSHANGFETLAGKRPGSGPKHARHGKGKPGDGRADRRKSSRTGGSPTVHARTSATRTQTMRPAQKPRGSATHGSAGHTD